MVAFLPWDAAPLSYSFPTVFVTSIYECRNSSVGTVTWLWAGSVFFSSYSLSRSLFLSGQSGRGVMFTSLPHAEIKNAWSLYLLLIESVASLLQDLTGQNSNDSSSGPAPGTPNSQGLRPTPSPTGSTGSRSMSPAVGECYAVWLVPSARYRCED